VTQRVWMPRSLACAPLSSLLCFAGLALGGLCLALTTARPAKTAGTEGALLVMATHAEDDLPGLDPGDPASLAARLPGLSVGGAREVSVAGTVPRLPSDLDLRVLAGDPTWAELASLRVARGRALDAGDERAAAAVCLLSPRVARWLEPGNVRIKLDESWWTVVGVLAEPEEEESAVDVLVPLRAGMLRLLPEEQASLDELRVVEPEDAGALAARVSRALNDLHGGRGAWRVEGEEVAHGVRSDLDRSVRGLLLALGACALVLGGMALRIWRAAGGPGAGAGFGIGAMAGFVCGTVALVAGPSLVTALGLVGTIPPLGLVAAVVGPVVGVVFAGLGRGPWSSFRPFGRSPLAPSPSPSRERGV